MGCMMLVGYFEEWKEPIQADKRPLKSESLRFGVVGGPN